MNPPKTSFQLTPAAAAFLAYVERQRPRVAAFDCDGTLWEGDTGEQFLYWTLERGLLPDVAVRWIQARYRDYKSGKVSEEAICGDMVTVHEGLPISTLEREADEFFAAKFVPAIFPEMWELVARLNQQGCQIWAVSSTNDWVVRAGVRRFGIPEERVLAACVHCDDGIASGRLWRVPTDEDKAAALWEVLQAPLDAAFGNSIHDAAMLSLARQAFAINPNPDLRQVAQQRGWKVYFPMGTAAHQSEPLPGAPQ
jgi:phosphoserine phosphatase